MRVRDDFFYIAHFGSGGAGNCKIVASKIILFIVEIKTFFQKRNSQHEILEDLMDPAFAKTHKFPDVNPHYENLENFLNQYFSLLAKSIMVDKCRVYCAKMLTLVFCLLMIFCVF